MNLSFIHFVIIDFGFFSTEFVFVKITFYWDIHIHDIYFYQLYPIDVGYFYTLFIFTCHLCMLVECFHWNNNGNKSMCIFIVIFVTPKKRSKPITEPLLVYSLFHLHWWANPCSNQCCTTGASIEIVQWQYYNDKLLNTCNIELHCVLNSNQPLAHCVQDSMLEPIIVRASFCILPSENGSGMHIVGPHSPHQSVVVRIS